MSFGNGLGQGIVSAAGSLPKYVAGNGSIHRDATDEKNVLYTCYKGDWYPGDAFQWPTAYAYVWYTDIQDGNGYIEIQNSTSTTYNGGADEVEANRNWRHLVNIWIWNNNGVGIKQFGPFGYAYPSSNPWVWSD